MKRCSFSRSGGRMAPPPSRTGFGALLVSIARRGASTPERPEVPAALRARQQRPAPSASMHDHRGRSTVSCEAAAATSPRSALTPCSRQCTTTDRGRLHNASPAGAPQCAGPTVGTSTECRPQNASPPGPHSHCAGTTTRSASIHDQIDRVTRPRRWSSPGCVLPTLARVDAAKGGEGRPHQAMPSVALTSQRHWPPCSLGVDARPGRSRSASPPVPPPRSDLAPCSRDVDARSPMRAERVTTAAA